MSSPALVHHNVERIDVDEELQREVRRLIERVDRNMELWARSHQAAAPRSDRPPLVLEEIDVENGA